MSPFLYYLIQKNIEKLDVPSLSLNPSAFPLLEKNPSYIDWVKICKNSNPDAIYLLIQNKKKITSKMWSALSGNHCDMAVDLLLKNPHRIDWIQFSENSNPRAINYLHEKKELIHWPAYCANKNASLTLLEENIEKCVPSRISTNPMATPLLEKAPELISQWTIGKNPSAVHLFDPCTIPDGWNLSSNPMAFRFLLNHPHLIDWNTLSMNPSEEAMDFFETFPEKIHWKTFSKNPNPRAISLLERNSEKIDWLMLSKNENEDIWAHGEILLK